MRVGAASLSPDETRGRRDRYPTRCDVPVDPVERGDPVVYPSRGGPLAPEQLGWYAERGYLTFDCLLGEGAVTQLLGEVERLAADPAVRSSERSILEPEGDALRSVFDVHSISDLFAEVVADPRLVGPARHVLGSEVYVHQSRVNRKPAFRGREFYWHSDFETWHAEDGMPAMRAVSLMGIDQLVPLVGEAGHRAADW